MNLRQQAAADLATIVGDAAAGFGVSITVTDPSGLTAVLTGLATDVGTKFDPETGQLVLGRRASVALSLSSLTAAGFAMPTAVSDTQRKPWVVELEDIQGTAHVFKVSETMPDRALGVVTCLLEAYR